MSWKDDVRTVLERDPAPKSFSEALMFSQGLHAVLLHRISHRLYLKGEYKMARLINYWARVLTGADIHPGATMGKGVFIDHATGVVIGETAIIGNDVSIFQGVTLGGVSQAKEKRHPTIKDNVIIGAHATVLGDIIIGENVKIGAGSVVVKDVPPNVTVVGIPGKVVQRKSCERDRLQKVRQESLPDPLMETLTDLCAAIDSLEKRIDSLEEKLKE
ncbi:serine acetyltransferase [Methanomassiliicoccales archaeon RumEn M1]|nr:serine acetyltransferase [Methanomassiliicoccales archaeon RumEn M1]